MTVTYPLIALFIKFFFYIFELKESSFSFILPFETLYLFLKNTLVKTIIISEFFYSKKMPIKEVIIDKETP